MAWTNAQHMFFRYDYLWSWLGPMHSICFADIITYDHGLDQCTSYVTDMITYDHGLDQCTAYVLQIWLLMIMAWTNAHHMIWLLMIMAWTNAHHMFFRYDYLWSWLGPMHSICFADMITYDHGFFICFSDIITYDHGLDQCTAYVFQIWLLMIMAWTNAHHMFFRYNYLWSWLGPMHTICFADMITYDHGLDQSTLDACCWSISYDSESVNATEKAFHAFFISCLNDAFLDRSFCPQQYQFFLCRTTSFPSSRK